MLSMSKYSITKHSDIYIFQSKLVMKIKLATTIIFATKIKNGRRIKSACILMRKNPIKCPCKSRLAEFLQNGQAYNHPRGWNPFFPTVPTFAVRETASLGQQMLELSCENATVGTNGLMTCKLLLPPFHQK